MRSILPGLAVAFVVALAAFFLARAPLAPFTLSSGHHPLSVSALAILLGILVGNFVPIAGAQSEGIRFCSRVILPLGIVLLGARLSLGDLVEVGLTGLLLSVVSIGSCALVVFLLIRWFSLPTKLTLLVGVGSAICGGSAIAAAAPVIEADDEDISWSVAAVALLGLVAMFGLPVLGRLVGIDSTSFGMWAGLTIHQTPQVVAAGLAYGGEAGEVATLIKLVRVTLLAPVVFVLGVLYARSRGTAASGGGLSWKKYLPPFVVGFLVMATLRSAGLLEFSLPFGAMDAADWRLQDAARVGDRAALALAMAAIGLETRFASFRRTGLKPLLSGLVASAVMIAATYAAIVTFV